GGAAVAQTRPRCCGRRRAAWQLRGDGLSTIGKGDSLEPGVAAGIADDCEAERRIGADDGGISKLRVAVTVSGDRETTRTRATTHDAGVDDDVPLIVNDDAGGASKEHAVVDGDVAVAGHRQRDPGGLDVDVVQR